MTAPTLTAAPDIAPVAALFADPTRARIVCALMDGQPRAASVLADEIGVGASTASEHLARLVRGGVLTVERSGRYRYYRLASAQVAATVEALSVLGPQPPVRSLRQSTRAAAMRQARTCYDHLAGRCGVAVTDGLVTSGVLARTAPQAYQLGAAAGPVLGRLGVDLEPLLARPRAARPLVRVCLDWSEQRPHVAGALGAALLDAALAHGWVRRRRIGRSVEITDAGRTAWRAVLGCNVLAGSDEVTAAAG